jgi:Protein of unknown function (DUF3102)
VTLDDLAVRIRAEHEQVGAALRRGVEHALRCGDLLLQAKTQVAHGEWLPWLEEHCVMAERTAQAYMKLARNRSAIEAETRNVADLGVRGALALLTTTQPTPLPDAPAPTPILMTPAEAQTAVERAARSLVTATDSAWRVAELTHHAVVELGAPLEGWCADIGLSPAEGYRYLGMWSAHGSAVLAGRWENVPEFWDADEVMRGGSPPE